MTLFIDSQSNGNVRPVVLNATEAFRGMPGVQVLSASPYWTSLRLRPDLPILQAVVDYFRHSMATLPEDLSDNLALVLHELLENAAEHGCGFDPSKSVDLTCIKTERLVLFQVRDMGPGFAMSEVRHAACNNPPNEPMHHVEYRYAHGMRPGGFGIVVARRIADELIYNDVGNEVTMIKYL